MNVVNAQPARSATDAPSATPAAPGIAIGGLVKHYAGKAALDGVDLDVREGEFFCVLGPSGCGKSTLLRLIAGLETPDAGTIAIAGRTVASPRTALPPEARGVAMVFQSYALWPHMSVRQNVAFVAESGGQSRRQAAAAADAALEAVALTPFAARRPAALSGGQQQRVALARCLAAGAHVLLMDEPLANLDPHLREAMEGELSRVHRASAATTIYITHDQREAMALATRIAVMDQGRILQVADPVTLYRAPASETVARFVGRGAIVDATVLATAGGEARVRLGEAEITARADGAPSGERREGPARLLLRPSDVTLTEAGPFAGTVVRVTWRGGVFEVVVACAGVGEVQVHTAEPLSAGEPVRFALAGGWVLPA